MKPGCFKPDSMPCPQGNGKCAKYLEQWAVFDKVTGLLKYYVDKPCRLFRCAWCRELRPACFGAADDKPMLCDACYAESQEPGDNDAGHGADRAAAVRGVREGDSGAAQH